MGKNTCIVCLRDEAGLEDMASKEQTVKESLIDLRKWQLILFF